MSSGHDAGYSPAAQRIMDGALFDLDGDHYWADAHFPDEEDAARDVVVLRSVEHMRRDQREFRRAVQMRDVEAWIDQDRIDFAFGPAALDVNISSGWTNVTRETEDLEDLLVSDHLGRRVIRPAWS